MYILPRDTMDEMETPDWDSQGARALPEWIGPLIVIIILITVTITSRRRDYHSSINRKYPPPPLDLDPSASDASESLLLRSIDDEMDELSAATDTSHHKAISRNILGLSSTTPNTSHYSDRALSRLVQRFPFLVEIFYLGSSYFLYIMVTAAAQHVLADSSIRLVASEFGKGVLWVEEVKELRFLFPLREMSVQSWFISRHPWVLWVLSRVYLLMHIPCTVAFLAWFYTARSSHEIYTSVRRTLVLSTVLAVVSSIIYPCAPPRLLPMEYGFQDPVYAATKTSVWITDITVLSAIPSLHFSYALIVGCAFIQHSGIFRSKHQIKDVKRARLSQALFIAVGVFWPMLSLVTGVATGNQYFLGYLIAGFFVLVAGVCNKILLVGLPFLDLFAWGLGIDLQGVEA